MQLALNKSSALKALRIIRSGSAGKAPSKNGSACLPDRMLTGGLANEEASELSEIRPQGMGGHFSNLPTIDLPVPDAAPRKRWTRGLAESLCLRIGVVFNEDGTLDVAVPDPSHRLKAAFAHNTVYSSASSLPAHSFVDLGVGVAIACPELIFAEMAETMDTPQLALLGYELCGSFARDSRDPRNGDVAVKVSPVTSVGKIRRFIEEAKWLRASERALYALEYVADNAWSPTESVRAVIALPISSRLPRTRSKGPEVKNRGRAVRL